MMYNTRAFRMRPMAVILGLLFASAQPAFAEEPQQLPDVDVKTTKEKPITNGYVTKKSSTSTKTETDLIDIPQSITVFNKQQMKDQAVQNLGDVVRYTPGVGAAQGEGNRETFIFRGVASTADFFQDGIRDDTQYYRDLYNVERVEVLKGPNGMIFGRGGAGGLINRVTKEANWNSLREIGLQYGSFDQARGTVDYNQAINDVAAFRLNAMYEDGNSYRDGVSLERKAINPTVTIKPSDNTKIVAGLEYFKDERIADRGIPSRNGRPVDTNDSTFFGNSRLSPTHTEVTAFNFLFEHLFDNGVTLKNRTRYANYNKFYQNVFANGSVTPLSRVAIAAYNVDTDRQNLINQTDLTFNWDTSFIKHESLVGVELGRQRTSNFRQTGFFNNLTTSVTVPLSDPTTNAPITWRQNGTDADNYVQNDTYAAYFQDQMKFSEQWSAIAGLRYDRFNTDYTNYRLTATNTNYNIKTSDDLFSPRVGLIFKPVENLSVYSSYTISYVPRAGEQLASLTATNKSFDPERYNNMEVGVKWDYSPDLALTAAVYKLERNKFAVADPANPGTNQVLVDGQEVKGVEIGINGKLTDAWSVAGGYAYQDAEFTKAQPSANALNVIPAGADVAQVPRHTFSLWNRYDFNEVWGAGLGVISRSEMYALAPTVSTSVMLPGYVRLDAAVFAQVNKDLRVQLNIENLLNKDYYLFAHTNNNITPGSPLAARLSVIANF
ncbi:TonB-dependent receptor [Methylophilus flavus]|jgi:catecholate siderophore receptor|uniref:TonB-dependent receptor n=1 Tax=Methylophilus flavus TaxID=640084 RepID=A0ABW3PC15_9PROT